MRIKKYLLYFLILVVAGAIAVSIFFALKNSNDQASQDNQVNTAGVSQAVDAENSQDLEAAEDTGEEDVQEGPEQEEPEIYQDYYTSSSSEFVRYTFKCPDGWSVSEEDSGKTLMVSNPGNAASGSGYASSEYIMIKVEALPSDGQYPQELLESYKSTADAGSYEMADAYTVDSGGRTFDISGYYYESGLTEENGPGGETEIPGEVDLMTYVVEEGNIYILKYMSSGIERQSASDTFTGFLESYEIGTGVNGEISAEEPGSFNILILGVDSGMGRDWGRGSARSDINMILHINLETYGATIVTIPRDLWVPIPGHDDGKINGAHAMGGPELAVETFENFSGLEIDNYIVTDFDGFIPLIDYLGGITIEVNEDLADGFSNCYLDKGVHHLNGEQALALCRNRHRSGDGSTQGGAWAREREAAKVIKALYEQKTTLEKILALPAFANFLLRYTWTDMDFRDIMKILPVLGNIGNPEIELRGVPSYSKMIGKASAVVHYEEETAQMFEEIKNQ